MSSEFGHILRVGVFGQSHGKAIGVTIHGLPAGEPIDFEELQQFLDRRKPGGRGGLTTARKETDIPEFLSGLESGVTCGFPLCAVIPNADQHSKDYSELADKPRPAHADYTAAVKWGGHADMRGGGHFSGRLTAPLCVAGGIAKQILARRGIYVGAHLSSIGTEEDIRFPLHPTKGLFEAIAAKEFPVMDEEAGARMRRAILEAKEALDSIGGTIECAAIGMPPGLGEPMFDGVENRLAAAIFGIPGLKGIEFGSGFAGSAMRGSQNNDPFEMDGEAVTARTNNAGGALGGITSGMPIVFRVAMKPTPSIARSQDTVSLSARENTKLQIHGRHDPCIAQRAVPVVEAVTAIVLLDMLMEGNHGTF